MNDLFNFEQTDSHFRGLSTPFFVAFCNTVNNSLAMSNTILTMKDAYLNRVFISRMAKNLKKHYLDEIQN